jgi:hypothetical protein
VNKGFQNHSRKMRWLVCVVGLAVLATSCMPARPAQSSATPVILPTNIRIVRPTSAPTVAAIATATLSAPATPTLLPRATAPPAPSATATAARANSAVVQTNPPATLVATGSAAMSVPSLDAHKYPAPKLLSPDDNAVYHVSQPVVRFAWGNTPADLMTFGQMFQCTSDATHFRKAFETNQIVIHSLDTTQADIVGWMDTGADYTLNLTNLPAGRYTWLVNIAVVCESYTLGQRDDTHPLYENRNNDPAYHSSTLQRTYLGPVSLSSAPRTFTWIP